MMPVSSCPLANYCICTSHSRFILSCNQLETFLQCISLDTYGIIVWYGRAASITNWRPHFSLHLMPARAKFIFTTLAAGSTYFIPSYANHGRCRSCRPWRRCFTATKKTYSRRFLKPEENEGATTFCAVPRTRSDHESCTFRTTDSFVQRRGAGTQLASGDMSGEVLGDVGGWKDDATVRR